MKKVALYARVSTDEQDLETQVERLENWAEDKDYSYDIYSEEVSSIQDRPQFNELIEEINSGESDYNIVAVTDLDRFGRSTRDILQKIDQLTENDVAFVCLDQPIDTREDNPVADVLVTILSAFAEFERKMMLKRQEIGLQKAKEEGRLGRPEKLTDEHKERVKEWREKGVSVNDIMLRLKEGLRVDEPVDVSKGTIYNALNDMEDDSV